jgi:uncharacterized protein (DUF1330 family)
MEPLSPSAEQRASFAEGPDGPVVMLNLLKFKRGGGSKMYAQYSDAFLPMLARHGGRLLYSGRCDTLLAGDQDWDTVALVEYPSRQVFVEVTSSEEYKKIAGLREGALERAVLYATVPKDVSGSVVR